MDPSAKTSFFQEEKSLFHKGKGVPLEGPFLGYFSQGNFGKVNENVHFSDFRMFCFWSPVSLGVLAPFHEPIETLFCRVMEKLFLER